MKIIVLPPGPTPVQKTASYKPKNLEEQLAAFLNANNPGGFKQESQETTETNVPSPPLVYPEESIKVVDILIELSNRYLVTRDRLKEYAKKLRNCSGRREGKSKELHESNATRFGIPISKAQDIVAKVLGYSSFQSAVNSEVNLNPEKELITLVILNKRNIGEFKEEFFPSDEE